MTGCECEQPGWCPRHQCEKTEHWHMLCRTQRDYFQLWEQGRGPGQQTSSRTNPATRVSCQHKGELLREQKCPSCRGHVRVKVFACALHGACTIARIVEGAACCVRCDDYQPETSQHDDLTSNCLARGADP
jgi:hypothetical protein